LFGSSTEYDCTAKDSELMNAKRYNKVSMSKKRGMQLNEKGMVSFMVTLIMLMVITLIVVGFSEVTRRNQREALDRQLSSQAFYAAESGVNVTKAAIANYVNINGFAGMSQKTSCSSDNVHPTDYAPAVAGGAGGTVTALSTSVGYTCVLVNPLPKSVLFPVTTGSSTVTPLVTTGSFQTLTFQWNQGNADANCAGVNPDTLPASDDWTCGFGVLRVDLVATNLGAGLNNSNLDAKTVTLFMTPLGGHSGTVTVPNYGTKAYIASASGCASGSCKVTVTLPGDSSSYYARLTSMYRDAPGTTITGTTASGAATFSGSQAVVDVTGKAQDELRRIQVRVALTSAANSSSIPLNAVASTSDICKHFAVSPSDTIDPTTVCD
jgi:Tfp pilus assembly protein PilX